MEPVELIIYAVRNLYEQYPDFSRVVERDESITQYEVVPTLMFPNDDVRNVTGLPFHRMWGELNIPPEFNSLIKSYFFNSISDAARNDIYTEYVVYRHPPVGHGEPTPVLLQKKTEHRVDFKLHQKYLEGEHDIYKY